jgi:fructose-specific component phosphotransferase system IIB-like protein
MKKTWLITVVLCVVMMVAGQLLAQGNIIFISRPDKLDTATGENPDKPFIDDLVAAGYTVNTMNSNALEEASQSKLDSLNNADLVIIGRSTSSGDFGGTHKMAWNNIEAPLLCLHLWALRNNRMNWFNSGSAPHYDEEGAIMDAVIEKPDDPVFAGLTPVDGQLPWAVGPYDVITITDGGSAEVLATSAVDGSIQFARFDPWVEFYPGAGDYPKGYRTFIGNGNDNLRGPDGSTVIFNYYNFTAESKQVYMAEVARMVGLGKVAKPEKTIVFAIRPDKFDDINQRNPDQPFIDELEAAGYNVIPWYNDNLVEAPQATVDTLNNADLVILGRGTPSSMYQNANKPAWNAIEAPILNIELWNVRSSRLNWFNSTATQHENDIGTVLNATLDMASDPVFAGITPDANGEVPWAVGPYDVLREKEAGNGHVVARSAVDESVLFVRFDPWIPFYPGAGNYPAGYRTMIGNGNDAVTDPATGLVIYNYDAFTPESKMVYMAEVERMVFLSRVPKPQKTIVYAIRPDKFDDINQVNPDQPFIDELQAAGYNVIPWYNDNLVEAEQATVDTLNDADLVIMGRGTPSSMFQNQNKLVWNAIEAPILNLELWNCRSSRLNWFNSTAMEHENDIGTVLNATLDMASDPVFTGITPDANGEVPWAVGPYDVLREKDAGNGQVVARSAVDSSVLFIRFDPWVEFYAGAGDRPAGYRTMIGNGNDAVTDPTSALVIYNYDAFTPESKMVYMAEVERMVWLGKVPKPASKGTIVYVSLPTKHDDINDVHADSSQIDELTAAGYEVITFYNNALELASEATLDTLNDADLVIIGRSGGSGDFGGDHKAAWNAVEAPMLCLHLWALRDSRMNWFASGTCTHYDDADVVMDAIVSHTDDYVFTGLGVANGDSIPWAVGPYDIIAVKDAGNGEVLAMSAVDSSIQFARFDPFVEFYEGAVDYPYGYRSYLGCGNDATTDATTGLTVFNYKNWTDESEAIFMNEVERLVTLPRVEIPDWVGVEQNVAGLPLVYELKQNYPNPFNPVTKIEFTLAKPGQTSLVIYNVMGQVVETLVNENMAMGRHQVDFNAGKHASGMYFYRLKSGDQILVRKMMLLK